VWEGVDQLQSCEHGTEPFSFRKKLGISCMFVSFSRRILLQGVSKNVHVVLWKTCQCHPYGHIVGCVVLSVTVRVF
jgi:hypothetical protein